MPEAVILSGAGRYADPWHRFADTSARLAALAHDSGWTATITEDIDAALADLSGIGLVIVNAGDPWNQPPDDVVATGDGSGWQLEPSPVVMAGRAGLGAALGRGISVLGMHTAAASLRDYPQFREALGGQWVTGRSRHPRLDRLHVRPLHEDIVEGLGDFHVDDEPCSDLVMDKDAEPLAGTHGTERDMTLAWARQYGRSRVVYDALGHDTRSYDSPGHRSFLRRCLTWLLPT